MSEVSWFMLSCAKWGAPVVVNPACGALAAVWHEDAGSDGRCQALCVSEPGRNGTRNGGTHGKEEPA